MHRWVVAGLFAAMTACGGGRPKPCGWYFAADRAGVKLGPIRWLSGVWRGPRETGDQIWSQLAQDGSMTGMWRRAGAAPGSDRLYVVRAEGARITLVELASSGSTTTYEAIEQGDRTVVFANPAHGHLRLRGDGHELDFEIERPDGATEDHHFWLES